MKLKCFLTPYTKINSKWIKQLNVRSEPIHLLEETVSRSLTSMLAGFFDMPPQARETKAKINKWDYIKLKSFFA